MSARIILVHGIHASEGKSNVRKLVPPLQQAGFDTVVFEYGFIRFFMARFLNDSLAKRLKSIALPGDIIVAHSNGCDITHRAANSGADFGGVVFINPALDPDRTTRAPWADIYYNAGDHITWFAKLLPFHSWGEMGSIGYTGRAANHTNYNTGDFPLMPKCDGHLDIFREENFPAWARFIARTIKAKTDAK
jgi:alpha-beta hydrolase superfamily lysophospholipase